MLFRSAATQRLQLVTAPDTPHAPLAGFGNMLPARTALGAKALDSPVLTLRLWAVKDLNALVAQTAALASDTSDAKARETRDLPPMQLAVELCHQAVPQRLLPTRRRRQWQLAPPGRGCQRCGFRH